MIGVGSMGRPKGSDAIPYFGKVELDEKQTKKEKSVPSWGRDDLNLLSADPTVPRPPTPVLAPVRSP